MESSCQVGGTGKERPAFLILQPITILFRGKKRSAVDGSSQAVKRLATSNDNQIDLNSLGPIDVKVRLGYFTTLGTDVILASQVGDFLILKADNEPTKNGEVKPPLWRVDGKTLIQKYECMDKVF